MVAMDKISCLHDFSKYSDLNNLIAKSKSNQSTIFFQTISRSFFCLATEVDQLRLWCNQYVDKFISMSLNLSRKPLSYLLIAVSQVGCVDGTEPCIMQAADQITMGGRGI